MFGILKKPALLVALAVTLVACGPGSTEPAGDGRVTAVESPTAVPALAEPPPVTASAQQQPLSGHRIMYFVESGT